MPQPVRSDRRDPGALAGASCTITRDTVPAQRPDTAREHAHEQRARSLAAGGSADRTTSASPTSTGSGSRSCRWPLPRTSISPARQSTSSSRSRRPRRRATPAAPATARSRNRARPTVASPVAARQQLADRGRVEPARERPSRRTADRRDRPLQRRRDQPRDVQVAQQRPQRTHQIPRPGHAALRALPRQERAHIRRRQPLQRQLPRPHLPRQEQPRDPEIRIDRPRRQPPLPAQIALILLQQPLDRTLRPRPVAGPPRSRANTQAAARCFAA